MKKHPLSLIGRNSAFADETVQAVGNSGAAALDRGVINVVQLHLVAGLQSDLGNPRAHRPGAHDANHQGFVGHDPPACGSTESSGAIRIAASLLEMASATIVAAIASSIGGIAACRTDA